MNADEARKGIAGYAAQQQEVLAAIDQAPAGTLTADAFDVRFERHSRELRVIPYGGKDAFFLGSLAQPGQWAWYLDLMQMMVVAGLVICRRVDGQLCYSRAGGESQHTASASNAQR